MSAVVKTPAFKARRRANTRRSSRAGLLSGSGLVLVLIGWVGALVIGHGIELQRLAVAVPFVAAGGFVACLGIFRRRLSLWWPALISLVLGLVYFGFRAGFSPVVDFGRSDLVLVMSFAVCLVVAATCLSSRGALKWFLFVLLAVFGAHFSVGMYQQIVDPAFAILRPPRIDQAGVSGLFWHRNYLGGMLEMMLPLAAGILLSVRGRGWQAGAGLVLVLGLILLVLTMSRGSIVSSMAGLVAVGWLFVAGKSAKWTPNKRMAGLALAIGLALAMGMTAIQVTKRVSEQRGQQEEAEQILGLGARLDFAGMAFDQWQEAPFIGTGSRSFSYKAVENWNAPGWLGDPFMTHNDYMQTLAEYGLVGILLVGVFGVIMLARGVLMARAPDVGDDPDGLVRGVTFGVVGALVAAMLHSTFDFSLHILPNLMLLALLLGFLVRPVAADEPSPGPGWAPSVMAASVLLVCSVVVIGIMWPQIRTFPRWLRYEQEMVGGDGNLARGTLDALGVVLEEAPEFSSLRGFAGTNLQLYLGDPVGESHRLEVAERSLREAVGRHPYDGEALSNLAYTLDLMRKMEEATGYHLRAVKGTWRREAKYGTLLALAANLSLRAERLLFEGRAAEALGYSQKALDYLDASRRAGFRAAGAQSIPLRSGLSERIDLLRAEGVEPDPLASLPAPPVP